jgi:1-acyl-sn-glycerol-3-phosphate acyltransferase
VTTLAQENGSVRGRASALPRPVRVLWRCVGFASFGWVALSIGYVLLPLQRLVARWRGDRSDPTIRAQYTIHRAMHHWVRAVGVLGFVRVSVLGGEALRRRGQVIVANHPSLIDTPVMLSVTPQADCIVSTAWSRNPFLTGCVAEADYLRAEKGAVMVRQAIARLRAGRTLLVYPEGSRTPAEGLRQFERGAAHIALRAGCDILPVVIRVEPRSLMKGQPFVDVPDRCPEWLIEVGEPIHPSDYKFEGEGNSAAARRITAVLQEYFEKRWDRGVC